MHEELFKLKGLMTVMGEWSKTILLDQCTILLDDVGLLCFGDCYLVSSRTMQLFENGLFSSLLYVWINGFSWFDVDIPAILFYFLKYFLVQFPATYTMATSIVIDTDDGMMVVSWPKTCYTFGELKTFKWFTESVNVFLWDKRNAFANMCLRKRREKKLF